MRNKKKKIELFIIFIVLIIEIYSFITPIFKKKTFKVFTEKNKNERAT